MDFVSAEAKFNELQARIRRGEAMSEDQYQEELAKLMVQDDSGVFWSLEPGTGRWLFFNGTEWVPGMPPKQQAAPPPVIPTMTTPVVEPPATYEAPLYQAPPSIDQTPTATQPTAEAPSYYVPSDVTRPIEYTGSYTGGSYTDDSAAGSSYVGMSGSAPAQEPEAMPTYVRVPEQDTASMGSGGIPPRPVREASPLAVPGGERAWLPFAFGALVLLLCAVVLFFGVRGLPFFTSGTAQNQPTEEPTEEVSDVLPTETVIIEPTEEPAATDVPTDAPQPTAAPQGVKAVATDVLNIRQGPARTTASLGKLQKGQEVTVVGRNGDGTWLQIQLPAKTDLGWVSADFVTVTGDVNTLPVTSGDSGGTAPSATETPTG
jgi:Bacterial SH3 domain